MFTSELQAECH